MNKCPHCSARRIPFWRRMNPDAQDSMVCAACGGESRRTEWEEALEKIIWYPLGLAVLVVFIALATSDFQWWVALPIALLLAMPVYLLLKAILAVVFPVVPMELKGTDEYWRRRTFLRQKEKLVTIAGGALALIGMLVTIKSCH